MKVMDSKKADTIQDALEIMKDAHILKIGVEGDVLNITHWNDVVEPLEMPPGIAADLLARLEDVWSWMPKPLRMPERQTMRV